ncbi:hypothetical protein HMPREF9163_00526 [Selenomonas sp. oral taxon 138 str. F0429]|nr:hypothetical protein HMPREF9163_00526 [Selenomonas sp. oral taxon 138 str. F0429]
MQSLPRIIEGGFSHEKIFDFLSFLLLTFCFLPCIFSIDFD